MSQSYFSASHSVPAMSSPSDSDSKTETQFSSIVNPAQVTEKDVQTTYIEQRDSILGALDGSNSLLTDLRGFMKESWVVRYPTLTSNSKSSETLSTSPSTRRPLARHTLSFADDPNKEIDVKIQSPTSSSPTRTTLKRAVTLATVQDGPENDAAEERVVEESLIPTDFQVLRLDLKLGPHGSSTSPGGLVSQLEKASIANLIDERIGHSLNHIGKLRRRIEDKSSKVLVTGDLNAGKSTLVNALLGREVMPVDQQPCTTMFCEITNASENGGVEEGFVANEGSSLSLEDPSTFTRIPLEELEAVISESDAQRVMKLYVNEGPSSSLINNGVVDISLIDAPGLNRDSIGTTEIFARQEEIDVVVFVVSAENHFTLSAKEFLFNASNEKAYIFVVVNKFDQIRDKAKCKRLVLEQIKSLSPRTWDNAEDLVHFVDSKSALALATTFEFGTKNETAFDKMEFNMKNFVLEKRARSKLLPAVTYMNNTLSDVSLLLSTNRIFANSEMEQAQRDLERSKPTLEKLKAGKQSLEDGLDAEEDITSANAYQHANDSLEEAVNRIGRGEVAVDFNRVNAPSSRQAKVAPSLPPYPGIMKIWDYASRVREVFLQSLELAVALSEDEARLLASVGVEKMFTLAENHLPGTGTDRPRRIFVPEAMFSPRRRGAVVAGGVHRLGIGMAQREELLDVTITDILALHHHFPHQMGVSISKESDDDDPSLSVWGLISLGLGAFTMVGGKAVGLRGVIEGVAHVGDMFGNERTRRWMAPVLGVATLGLSVYVFRELPKTIPRSIGRQMKSKLITSQEGIPSDLISPRPTFVEGQARRIEKETRKVLRMAAWDSREKFRVAYEDSSREVKVAEDVMMKSEKALKWFDEADKRIDVIQESIAKGGVEAL